MRKKPNVIVKVENAIVKVEKKHQRTSKNSKKNTNVIVNVKKQIVRKTPA